MTSLHSLRVEAVVAADYSARLVDRERVEGLLCALSDEAGPGQSSYDPQVAMLDGPESGLSAVCIFPGGHVTLHTFEAKGRLPGRYVLEITACDPLDTSTLILLAERHLGLPSDYQASTRTRGWTV